MSLVSHWINISETSNNSISVRRLTSGTEGVSILFVTVDKYPICRRMVATLNENSMGNIKKNTKCGS